MKLKQALQTELRNGWQRYAFTLFSAEVTDAHPITFFGRGQSTARINAALKVSLPRESENPNEIWCF